MSRDPRKMSSEDLANMVRTIKITGIAPSTYEQECLSEAADRLDQMDEILVNFIDYIMNEINTHYPEKWANGKDTGELVCDCTIKDILDIMNTCKENIWSHNNDS